MHPHPPATNRTRDIPNIKSRTYQRFPGMGDPLRGSDKHSKQSGSKGSKSSDISKNRKVDNASHQLHRSAGYSNRRTKPVKINLEKKITSLNHPHVKGPERRESFSKFKLLPEISHEKEYEGKQSKSCNKRTFATWSGEECPIMEGTTEKDESLSDTIKKMKLGTDALYCGDASYSNNDVEKKPSRNPFDRDKNDHDSIELIIRLPDGERKQHSFAATDTLKSIIQYLSRVMKRKIDLENYVLYTNEVPKKEIKDSKSSLLHLGILNKSVIALDKRDLP